MSRIFKTEEERRSFFQRTLKMAQEAFSKPPENPPPKWVEEMHKRFEETDRKQWVIALAMEKYLISFSGEDI